MTIYTKITFLLIILSAPNIAMSDFGDDGVSNCTLDNGDEKQICSIAKARDVAYSTLYRFYKFNRDFEIAKQCDFLTHSDLAELSTKIAENSIDGDHAEWIAGEMHMSMLDEIIEHGGFIDYVNSPKAFCKFWAKEKSEVYSTLESLKIK